MAAGEDYEDTIDMAERAMSRVLTTITNMGLRVAPNKTEVMLFGATTGGARPGAALEIAGTRVTIGPTIKYLGLWLDGQWKFLPHLRNTIPKVDRMSAALARLLPNLRGPSAKVRRLYATVVHSVLLYGAPI